MIDIISGTADNLIVAVARGRVTAEDYEKIFVPAIHAALKTHNKIRLLYQLGEDFTGFTGKAIWTDAKLRLRYLTYFEAVAVVSNVRWIANAVEFFSFFMQCPVRAFSNRQLTEARDWVSTAGAWTWTTGTGASGWRIQW